MSIMETLLFYSTIAWLSLIPVCVIGMIYIEVTYQWKMWKDRQEEIEENKLRRARYDCLES